MIDNVEIGKFKLETEKDIALYINNSAYILMDRASPRKW
jgi:hypothetical protein